MLRASPPHGTAPFCNPSPEQLRALTGAHLQRVASAGIGTIDKRLAELERECPSERILRRAAAAATVVGLVLAVVVSPWLLVLPALSGLLFAQLCFGPCCVMSSLLCRRGLRSTVDIERERTALHTLRSDFHALPSEALIPPIG